MEVAVGDMLATGFAEVSEANNVSKAERQGHMLHSLDIV